MKKIIKFNEIDSTNEFLKNYEPQGDFIAVAKVQTGGRGTKGRSFVSDAGGLYLSIRREYEDFSASRAFEIMINACVAVCKTLEFFGVQPIVRWANDILCGGKKICGTLIENSISKGYITRSIVGIGLNVSNTLPEELEQTATTLLQQTGRTIPLKKVQAKLIDNLQKNYSVDDYKNYINWLGTEVTLHFESGEVKAIAKNIDKTGRLVCEINGKRTAVSSAEVTLRI